MKVYVLERKEPQYDDIDTIAVKAETKEEARQLVYEDLLKSKIDAPKASDFLDHIKSNCYEIDLDKKGVFILSYWK